MWYTQGYTNIHQQGEIKSLDLIGGVLITTADVNNMNMKDAVDRLSEASYGIHCF